MQQAATHIYLFFVVVELAKPLPYRPSHGFNVDWVPLIGRPRRARGLQPHGFGAPQNVDLDGQRERHS